MKNSVKSAAFIAFLVLPVMSKSAFAGEVPDCRDTPEAKYAKNYWNVLINDGDRSDKSDILNALKVIGTGGFKAENLIDFGEEAIYVNLRFDGSYYGDAKVAKDVLDGGLKKLVSLRGVVVYCDGLVAPFPGITVRN